MTLIPRGFVVVATPLLLLGLVCDAAAMCDVVPGAPAFRGFRGQLDRPFASPGDWIELRPNDVCAAGSPAFADLEEGKLAISLVFKPRPKKKKKQNKKHAVVLTRNCGDVDMGVFGLQANRTHCVATQDGFKLQLGADSSEHKLDIRFPAGICVGGTHPRLPCEIGGSCPGGGICKKAEGKRRLTGLMALAVTQEQSGSNPAKKPLPTDLVAKRCQNVSQETTACVDFLYPMDGSCDTQERDDVFPSLVALPPPNDYQKLCTHADPTSPDSPDCLGTDTNLRFALDVRGDALIPIRWKKIKNPTEGRFVQTSTAVPPVAGDTGPVRLPNDDFVTSFSVKGKILPALFEPELSPSRPNELTLFGVVDGNRSVLRVSRRYREEGEFKKCVGGGPLGHPCSKNQDCAPGTCTKESVCRVAGGELCKEDGDCAEGVDCGLSLFAQRSRNQGGTGPAVISRAPPEDVGICDETGLATPDNDGKYCDAGVNCAGACVDLRAEAGAHVPFAPLPQSEQLIASVIPEAAVRRSFNGDIDLNDAVVTVREIASGNLIPIGMGNGCDVPQSCSALASCTSLSPGRASHADPNNPKQDITVSGNLVSFIEKCSDQPANSCTADALRIFSRACQDSSGKSLPQMIEVVGTPPVSGPLVLDPSPVIDGKSAQITPSEQLLLRDPCGVLNAIDLRNGGLKAPRFAEPATLVVTAGDSVAFLQPESPPRMAGCTQPVHARDLNGDGDVKDVLVRLWPGPDDELWPREGGNGGSAMNPKLWLDATEVALSEGWLAAIARDGSVNVRALKDPKQEWSPVGRGGEKLAASGDVVAYLERERGNRLLRVHFPAAPRTEPAEFSAVDFVLGDLQPSGCVGGAQPSRQLLAFRSDEIFFAAPQQEAVLRSSDGPFLHLIDLGRAAEAGMLRAGLLSSGEPASRCDVPLCPDGPPYEVLPRMIRFFSREPGSDRLLARVIDTCDARLRSPPVPGPVKRPFDGFRYAMDPTLTGVFLGGRCVDGKEALGVCLADEDCPAALSCGPAVAVIYARDGDGDGIDDSLDNCPKEYNRKQTDSDGDGVGDECEGS